MSFLEQIDYYGKMTAQLPPPPLRVLYSKAGILPAAAILADPEAFADHKLYWTAVDSEAEGAYLLSILNSETARARVAHFQSRGQWGARDFDKVMFELPIPKFDPADRLHKRLAAAAARAEKVASGVVLHDGEHFIHARGRIRSALAEDGIAAEIDRLVEELL